MNKTIAALGTTIFETMSGLARTHDAINLGQGFPDAPGPPELLDAAARALRERSNQYPPMRGLPELRAAIAGYYETHQGVTLADDEIIVTSGATEALAATLLALLNPGDEAILVQPLYDAYAPLVRRAGGVPKFINLTPPHWTLPVAEIAAAITPATRLLLLNSPHNPTGAMLSRTELEAVARLCVAQNLILLCDEVWEAMVFGAAAHVSALTIADLRDRTVKIGSAGKLFSLTGWKVGWACAAPQLATAIARAHQFLTFTTPPALQWAVTEGLALPSEWQTAHRNSHAAGRARLINGLGNAGYAVLAGPATWFVHVDLVASGITISDVDFCQALVRDGGVAAIPISAFYEVDAPDQFVRFCFTKPLETLDEAVARLARFKEAG